MLQHSRWKCVGAPPLHVGLGLLQRHCVAGLRLLPKGEKGPCWERFDGTVRGACCEEVVRGRLRGDGAGEACLCVWHDEKGQSIVLLGFR